jgi:PAS domain S-box-containing protein
MDDVEVLEIRSVPLSDEDELVRLRDFFDHASVGLHFVDADGMILQANRADHEMLGYAASEYIGHNICEFHADAPVIGDILERLSRGETLHEYPARLLCKDGSIRHVLIDSSVNFVNGRFINTRCLTRDVTEQYRAAEALREKSRQLELVTDAMPALISYINANGRYEFVNRRYEEWFGMTAAEIRGLTLAEVLGADAYRVLKPHLDAALAGEQQEFELETPYRTGTRWIRASYVPDKNEGERTLGFFALVTDISEHKELEQKRQALLEESQRGAEALAAANRAKDEFLGMVSHELRTPLTTILGNAQILTRRLDLLHPSESRSVSDDIYKESVRLTNIVENLLLMARFEAGQKLELEPIVLRAVVSRVIREVARVSLHQFEMAFPPEVAYLLGNETCVEQVVRNLVSNAEKYSRPGTKIEVSIEDGGDKLMLHVADRGLGIAPEESEQVFEPFFRSAASSSSRSGVGIGLSVCKRLVDAMGGRIWAEARPDGGSIFSFSLPKCEEAPTAPSRVRRS